MGKAPPTAFNRLASSTRVRDVQQTFAFTWNVDEDGWEEALLIRRYIQEAGALSTAPVLLTGAYRMDDVGARGSLPFGVWSPERVLCEVVDEHGINEHAITESNEDGLILGGMAAGTTEFPIGNIIAADQPLLALFEESCDLPRLVCDGLSWTGIVRQQELFAPASRMCLFALALELEESATALCRTFAKECFPALPPARMQKAIEILHKRFGRAPTSADEALRLTQRLNSRRISVGDRSTVGAWCAMLIDCTEFADKKTMLSKCKLLIDVSNTQLKSVFERTEKIRNLCAHSGADMDDVGMSVAEIRKLVSDLHGVMRAIQEANTREWTVRSKEDL